MIKWAGVPSLLFGLRPNYGRRNDNNGDLLQKDLLLLLLSRFSRVQLFESPWTVDYQASLSMGFSRQEYWIGLPLPSPGDLPDPGIEPGSLASQADALPSKPPKSVHQEKIGLKIY